MTTIQVHIPDDLASKVKSLAPNTEEFIVALLRSKVRELKSFATLAEEYRQAAKENISLMKDFAHTDLEGWADESAY